MQKVQTTITCFLLVLMAGTVSCQKNNLKTSPLSGTWIETGKRADTMVFAPEYDGRSATFELKRGTRMADGYTLPGYYSGPYWYNLSTDSISMYWFLSSGSFQSYFFRMVAGEQKFMIGNFFKSPENSSGERDTLVFVRIK